VNYQKHYNKLIFRSPKTKPNVGYFERHRIIPGCLGGKYIDENIVWLTPEEHYVAHQFLVKIYPDNKKLIFAAKMMTVSDGIQKRGNKLYGWLRRKFVLNHPCKDSDVKKQISESLKVYYKSLDWEKRKIHLKSKSKEIRMCVCGCGESFICYKKDKKKYAQLNCIPKPDYFKVSKTMKEKLKNYLDEDMKKRLQNSLWNCDHIERGKNISKGKKGKSTNQQKIMGEKYSTMTDFEFDTFLLSIKPQIKNRLIKLRKRYIDAN